jgi:hypothetical protein
MLGAMHSPLLSANPEELTVCAVVPRGTVAPEMSDVALQAARGSDQVDDDRRA